MRIDFNKLNKFGFRAEYSEKDNAVTIFPENHNEKAHRTLERLAGELQLNNSESEELFSVVSRLVTFNAIRRASGG